MGMSVGMYVISSLLISNFFLWGIGGAIHYWYFVHKKDREHEWKMQQGRSLSKKLARQGAMSAFINMNVVSIVGGIFFWGIVEKGWGQIYFNFWEHSIGYTLLSAIGTFLFIETCAYHSHVLLHKGWWYKRFHSKHHRYKTPEWYTLASMDPIEWLFHSSYLMLPAFFYPLHIGVFVCILAYFFIAGFWDHIGAKLPFNLPFHGNAQFHDDHHKYVHVNFGFLCDVYDRIYDTLRREGHHYTEESFAGGKGIVRDFDAIKDKACGPQIHYPNNN